MTRVELNDLINEITSEYYNLTLSYSVNSLETHHEAGTICSELMVLTTLYPYIFNIIDDTASEIKSSHVQREFNFLIFSKLLRGSLEEHVTHHQVSSETVLQVECVERDPPPRLGLELDHKDWVSAVHCYQNL